MREVRIVAYHKGKFDQVWGRGRGRCQDGQSFEDLSA